MVTTEDEDVIIELRVITSTYSSCQTKSNTFMHCKQNQETLMFTDILPNISQVEQNRLEFNFDVHLSCQHREKPSKIEFQVILSTTKCLVLCW